MKLTTLRAVFSEWATARRPRRARYISVRVYRRADAAGDTVGTFET